MADNAQGIRAGKAYVEVGAKDSALAQGLDAARKRLQSWGKTLAHLGLETAIFDAAKMAPFLAAARSFAGQGSDLAKWSGQLGISARDLSSFQGVAAMANVRFEDLLGSFRHFRTVTVDAANGGEEALKALRAMGYTFEQWDRLAPARQLEAVVAQANRFTSVAARTSFLDTMGVGDELMPLILRGVAGMRHLSAEAERLGMVLSDEDVAAAERLRAAWAVLGMQWQRFVANVGAAMAGPLEHLAEWFSTYAVQAVNWVKANRGLIWSTLEMGAAWVAAGVAVGVLGAALHVLGTVLGWLATAARVTTLAFRFFFLSWPGWVLLAVGAAVALFVLFTDAGRQMAEDLGKAWAVIAADAGEAFGAIGQAISNGDLRAAWGVLTAFVKLEWTRLLNWLRGIWDGFGAWTVNRWFDLQSSWIEVVGVLKTEWADALRLMENNFGAWGFKLRRTMNNVSGDIAGIFELMRVDVAEALGDKNARAGLGQRIADIDQQVRERNARLDRRENQTPEERAAADAERRISEAALARRRQEANEEQRRRALGAGGAGEAERERDLADAQRELREAIAAARRPGGAFEERHEQLRLGGAEAGRGSTMRDLQRFGLDQQRQSVVGSFNPYGFSRLGGGGRTPLVFDRIDNNTRTAAEKLRVIEERGRDRRAQDGLIRFA